MENKRMVRLTSRRKMGTKSLSTTTLQLILALVIASLLSVQTSNNHIFSHALSSPSRTMRISDMFPPAIKGSSATTKTTPHASFVKTFLKEDDSYSIATLLLGTLLEQRSTATDSSVAGILLRANPDFQTKQERQRRRIEEYVTLLSDMPNNTYDPSKCLLGPLYCTLFSFNPSNPTKKDPPLWEKISLKAENLKGQQYFVNQDFELSVVNYAEIWGRQLAIRAQATFSPLAKEAEKEQASKKNQGSSFLDGILSNIKSFLFPNDNNKEEQQQQQPGKKLNLAANLDKSPDTALRSCPDRFKFRTYAAEFQFGGTVVPIPIEGTAQFAVLYADPRLRILLSPTGSQSVVGPWEQTGLVVVQVRSDLVTSDAAPLDLR